ncbi:MAG: hypothetical protein JO102_03990, partial [Elusimicrobia bacterium]|nr:hypothetical protein [Elusimicrobiota bacterium]
ADQAYQLTINANYNRAIVRSDGYVERKGDTYSGVLTVNIPYGGDYSFGTQLMDLH